MQCQPCEQPPGLASPSTINGAATLPTIAMNPNGCAECVSWSGRVRRPKQAKLYQSTVSLVAKQQRQWCRERKTHGVVPTLVLAEGEPTIGNRHGSSVRTSSAKQGEIRSALGSWTLPSVPSFIEIPSGPGRLAAAVRQQGITAYEYDLCEHGGRTNLLQNSVLQ